MYYVNKIVGWITSPMGLFFFGILAGTITLLCAKTARLRRIGIGVLILAFVELWMMSCGVTVRLIGLPLEGEEADLSALPKAEAIVLLGGGLSMHEKCGRYELQFGSDRTVTAAHLWHAGKAPLVTVSGGHANGERAFLAELNVPETAIRSFEEARNTEEEARLIRRGLEGSRAHPTETIRILLVTSAWHMPRAKNLFERAGFEVIAAPTDYEMHCIAESPLEFGDFIPNPDALMRNTCAVKEWVARVGYAIKR